MTSGKSCIRCAKPLPVDSVSEFCKACTPDGRSAETPESRRPANSPLPSTIIPKPRSPFDETSSRPEDQGFLTNPAEPGQLNADIARLLDVASKLGNEPIVIDGYTLFGEIGRGGGGSVYEAVQIKTKRRVAIKILLGQSLSDRVRFDRETKALGKLNDPRVINVHEAGVCNAGPYFCMERMTGGSLADLLKTDGPLEPKKAGELLESISRGMEVVHQAGLFHRDLKPGNILLDGEGKPKIADFGLAKTYKSDEDETTAAKISLTGGFLGTPSFMAPEQAAHRNSDVDARTDIYGLGAILYQCLTGKTPFSGKSTHRLLDHIINDRPTDPSSLRPGISRELEAICLKCLEKNPNDRYQSAELLADDLAAWLRGDETIARPATRLQRAGRLLKRQRRPAAIAALIIASAATINLAGMWLKDKSPPPVVDDPERELKQIVEEIKSGEKVTLVGETGLPRFYYRDSTPEVFQASRYGDNSCSINSTTETFLELLREKDLPDAIRIEADVRHEFAVKSSSRAGIFFGKFEFFDASNRRITYFHRLAFSDHLRRDFGDAQSFINYNPSRLKITPGELSETGYTPVASMPISSPDILAIRNWRHLDVSIKRESVQINTSEEKQQISPKSEFNKDEIFSFLLDAGNLKAPEPELQARSKDSIFRGSLGIYATEGIANFKNVTIQKLTTQN